MATTKEETRFEKMRQIMASDMSEEQKRQAFNRLDKSAKANAISVICDAAVKLNTGAKINKALADENGEIYMVKNDKLTEYFKKCTRAVQEGCQYCHKHNISATTNPQTFKTFDNVKRAGKRLNSSDEIETKTSKRAGGGNDNALIVINCTQTLKKHVMEFFGFDGVDVNIETEKKAKTAKTTKNKGKEEESEKEEEKEETESESEEEEFAEAKDEEDSCVEAETTPIQTKSGRELNLYEDKVYDDDGEELGKFVEVSEKNAPIEYRESYYIVGEDVTHGGIDYVRCVLSDVLYRDVDGNYKKAGSAKKQKDGSFKFTINKTIKK